jgi:hypothetical protein
VWVDVKPFTVEEEADDEGVIMQGQEFDAVDNEIIDQGAKDSAFEDALLPLRVSNELFKNKQSKQKINRNLELGFKITLHVEIKLKPDFIISHFNQF